MPTSPPRLERHPLLLHFMEEQLAQMGPTGAIESDAPRSRTAPEAAVLRASSGERDTASRTDFASFGLVQAIWRSLRQTSILALALTGCVTPVMHPFRASDGPFVNESMSAQLPGGHGCADPRVCASPSQGSAGGLNLQLSSGYSHVFADHFGVMAGLYFPAWKTHKMGFSWKSLVGLYTFVTVQTDRFSIGAGPEISAGGWGVTTGGEVRSWPTEPWAPTLSLYHRWLWPFYPTHEAEDNHAASRELGARIGVGPFFTQYAYHQQLEGVFCYSLIESASCGSAVHIISLGLLADEKQLDLLGSDEP